MESWYHPCSGDGIPAFDEPVATRGGVLKESVEKHRMGLFRVKAA